MNRDELGKKLHLFRSYIDKQNIDYIRNNYQGENDYEKLLAYAKDKGITMDYSTGASYHNRKSGNYDFTYNMKVQVPKDNTSKQNNARMSEFIVDLKTGQFVSEWNAYDKHYDAETGLYDSNPEMYTDEDKYQIANTESFNYGLSKGQNSLSSNDNDSHKHLDVNHPKDNLIRQNATKIYTSEADVNKPNKDGSAGRYADIVKKEEDYEAWQQVPEVEKQKVYDKYVNWLTQSGFDNKHNPGIIEFFKSESLYGY